MAYIIIVNYKRWEDTKACVDSLLLSTYQDFKVIVVENNSPNDSFTQLSTFFEEKNGLVFENPNKFSVEALLNKNKLHLLRSPVNGGFAAGNNLPLRIILKEEAFVWLLNPDMVVDPNCLQELLEEGKQDKFAVIGCQVKSFYTKEIAFWGGSKINYRLGTVKDIRSISEIGKIDYISGGSLFTHLSNFQKIGLMREDYFLYWEETEWCHRAKENGLIFKVITTTTIYNKESTSIGKGYLADYYYTLNSLRFIQEYSPRYLPQIVLIFNNLRILKRLFLGKFQNIKAILNATIYFFKKYYY